MPMEISFCEIAFGVAALALFGWITFDYRLWQYLLIIVLCGSIAELAWKGLTGRSVVSFKIVDCKERLIRTASIEIPCSRRIALHHYGGVLGTPPTFYK